MFVIQAALTYYLLFAYDLSVLTAMKMPPLNREWSIFLAVKIRSN